MVAYFPDAETDETQPTSAVVYKIDHDPKLGRIAGVRMYAGRLRNRDIIRNVTANRDEKIFDRPEDFDVSRNPNPHLSLGFGVHYCVGANLARLEARIALETLLEKTRHMERADNDPLPLHPSPVFRAASRIPVRLEPA